VLVVGVRSLGYVRLVSDRAEEWDTFATQILGMMSAGKDSSGARRFRIDDYTHRLSVSAGGERSLQALGYEVASPAELDDLVHQLEQQAIIVTRGTDAECDARSVTAMVKFTDPGGVPVELFCGPQYDYRPVQTPLVSGFVSGPDIGMGHTALACPNAAKAADIYMRVLGFAERNTMRRNNRRTWFLSPNPRQHTAALTESDGFRLSHFMLEMRSVDDVGRALDRVAERDFPLLMTLGRHTNDRMLSFYVVSPDGFSVEVGCDGLMVSGSPPTFEIPSPTLWGHHRAGERS
jgi:3,4-dihydroxy-9,10-secoandrosta-1,3,5(10)-triene-9,17-dione 4,5-dioxygenase